MEDGPQDRAPGPQQTNCSVSIAWRATTAGCAPQVEEFIGGGHVVLTYNSIDPLVGWGGVTLPCWATHPAGGTQAASTGFDQLAQWGNPSPSKSDCRRGDIIVRARVMPEAGGCITLESGRRGTGS